MAALLAASTLQVSGQGRSSRDDLVRSFTNACRQFDGDSQWQALQACNLAWFRAHEQAVWQLNLNPHRATVTGPAS